MNGRFAKAIFKSTWPKQKWVDYIFKTSILMQG